MASPPRPSHARAPPLISLLDSPPARSSSSSLGAPHSLLSPSLELTDPHPDIHALFLAYDASFFGGALAAGGVEVRWSPRMTLCAGLCAFQPATRFCSVRLSEPLLKLRPRADLVNTLLHEMTHGAWGRGEGRVRCAARRE